jgi:hypothetical protein
VSTLDWTVVRTAATGGLIILIPSALLAGIISGAAGGSQNVWRWIFLAVSLLAYWLAGFLAGNLRNDTPMVHGIVSALIAAAVAMAIALFRGVWLGELSELVTYGVGLALAALMGALGALSSDVVRRRKVHPA